MRPSEILDLHRDEIRKIALKFEKRGLYNLRVFGSVATGEDTEDSDIDFLIDHDLKGVGLAIGGLYYALDNALPCKIDLLMTGEILSIDRDEILSQAKPI